MIRIFIKSIVSDLANAVARSELVAENARLRAELAAEKKVADDWRATSGRIVALLLDEPCLVATPEHTEELVREKVDDLRARLEAVTNERDHIREEFANAVKAAERRIPVDREAAIRAAKAVINQPGGGWDYGELVDAVLGAQRKVPAEKLTTAEAVAHICRELQSDPGYRIAWVANIAMQFKDRLAKAPFILDDEASHKLANEAAEGFIELLCKDAPRPTREAPAEKPAAFVPAETDAEPSAELVERMAIEAFNVFNHSVEGYDCGWNHASDARKNGDRASARALYCLIARDHAAAVKRVGELEAELGNANRERGELRQQLDDERAKAARLSAPCPADGMSDTELGQAVGSLWNNSPSYREIASKARELFGRAAK